MPNKKINQLDVKVAVSTDLMLVGDPTSGTSFKSTLATLPLVPTSRTLTINGVAFDLSANRAWTISSGTVTSVGLTMPSAFSVANSPITSSGTLAVTALGTASQYIRGDGQLANFPDNGGGGSAFNYYLNGSVNQGTFGGNTYYEMSKTPVLGAGTNFTRTNAQGNGYIASFITDAGDPSLLNIPGGNWNLEFYFASSASGGSPQFYGELYKVDASNNFTLVASGSANPEGITNGTTVDQYFTSISVPQTSLLVTDRLAIRIYVIPSGRTITLHTENSNLCEVLTTFSTGLNALNGLTSQVQYFATGTSGTDFGISSASDTHTFNLPTASATNRGALSSADWTTFNGKASGNIYTANGTLTSARTLTLGGFTLDFIGSSHTSKVSSAGRFLIGSPVESTFILDVNGTARISGASTFSGIISFGAAYSIIGSGLNFGPTNDGTNFNNAGTGFMYAHNAFTIVNRPGFVLYSGGTTLTSGTTNLNGYWIATSINSSSGNANVNFINIGTSSGNQVIINTSGTYSGIIRGFYFNPTLTSTTGATIRAIETITGDVVLGSTSGNTFICSGTGNLLVGTNTVGTFKLDVNGTTRITGLLTCSGGLSITGAFTAGSTTLANFQFITSGNASATGLGFSSEDASFQLQAYTSAALSSFPAYFRFRHYNNSVLAMNFANQGIIRVYNIGWSDGNVANISGNSLWLQPVYNFSVGSLAGIVVRGMYYDPVATSLTNVKHVAIETRSGDVLLGTTSGSVGVGVNSTINASAQVEIISTTKGFLPPRMTSSNKTSIATPAAGLIVFDTTLNKLCVYSGTSWETITSI
jgi:hypothetical protein